MKCPSLPFPYNFGALISFVRKFSSSYGESPHLRHRDFSKAERKVNNAGIPEVQDDGTEGTNI